jgi:peroxiredoxin
MMAFGLSAIYNYFLYSVNNNDGNRIELEQYDGEKDIGVLVDENLSFNKHIQNQVNKANSIMGLIRRTYTYLDEQTLHLLGWNFNSHVSDKLCKLSKSDSTISGMSLI